jgi:hypothetical protein
MAYFTTDAEVDVSPDEFITACSNSEIKTLIEILKADGHLKENGVDAGQACSPMEEMYELDVNKLHGSYHILGTDEIDLIHKIAKRL